MNSIFCKPQRICKYFCVSEVAQYINKAMNTVEAALLLFGVFLEMCRCASAVACKKESSSAHFLTPRFSGPAGVTRVSVGRGPLGPFNDERCPPIRDIGSP